MYKINNARASGSRSGIPNTSCASFSFGASIREHTSLLSSTVSMVNTEIVAALKLLVCGNSVLATYSCDNFYCDNF